MPELLCPFSSAVIRVFVTGVRIGGLVGWIVSLLAIRVVFSARRKRIRVDRAVTSIPFFVANRDGINIRVWIYKMPVLVDGDFGKGGVGVSEWCSVFTYVDLSTSTCLSIVYTSASVIDIPPPKQK